MPRFLSSRPELAADPTAVGVAAGPSGPPTTWSHCPGHLPSRRPVHPRGQFGVRSQGGARAPRRPRVPHAVPTCTVRERHRSSRWPWSADGSTTTASRSIPSSSRDTSPSRCRTGRCSRRASAPETVSRLLDALVLLLARLHLVGFLWGGRVAFNVLFLRTRASSRPIWSMPKPGSCTRPSRKATRHDRQIATTNLYGEFSDLQAGQLLDASLDPQRITESIIARYRELWSELTGAEEFAGNEIFRIEKRVRRLNALGFDVAELAIDTLEGGSRIRIHRRLSTPVTTPADCSG